MAALVAVLAACVGDAEMAVQTPGPDAASADAGDGAGPCAVRCVDPSTLAECDGTSTKCQFECTPTGTPHCTAIAPTGIVPPSMLDVAGTTAIALVANVNFFTDTGAIADLRVANQNASKLEVKSGIGYQLVTGPAGQKVATWSFASLTVPSGIVARFTSANPAALIAKSTVTIVGLVDIRGYDASDAVCGHGTTAPSAGGPGGGAGGLGASAATGLGAGHPGVASGSYFVGPSAGSYGGAGGSGGTTGGGTMGTLAGAPYGDFLLTLLTGGSGGGGNGFSGGGGGGALQIVAGERITIGGGASAGGINAGGCGGAGGASGNPGGAGGSGGAILLEAPVMDLQPNGTVAANGGGGAVGGTGGGNSGAGQPGDLGVVGGVGGTLPGTGYGLPGVGGAKDRPNGGNGDAGGSTSGSGGSGGGSVGRIRINNLTGTLTLVTGATLSPSKDIATNPPTTFGVIDVH